MPVQPVGKFINARYNYPLRYYKPTVSPRVTSPRVVRPTTISPSTLSSRYQYLVAMVRRRLGY